MRKKDLPSKKAAKRGAEEMAASEMEAVVPSRLHRVKRRSGVKRWIGLLLIAVVLVGAGWFATKLAMSGWNFNTSIFSNLFNFGGTKLIGENQDRVNVVLAGIPGSESQDGPNLTDTVIVASLSTEKDNAGTNFMFSLPRDLYVKIPNDGNSKLNAVYETGNDQGAQGGGKLLSQVTGQILGLEVPYYIRIDFSGFRKVIDELGGITVTVDKDLKDDKYPGPNNTYQTVDIKAGTYTMDGEMALKYARSRQSTSDFDRAARQQKVLLAIRDKAMELNMLTQPTKVLSILDIVKDSIDTNLTLPEMKRFISLVKGVDMSKLVNKVFDDSAAGLLYAGKVNEAYVLRPVGDDFKIISDYVASVISGEKKPDEIAAETTATPLKIEVLNGTNVTGLAGKIATTLKAQKYEIVKTGNNSTKGVAKTMVYDLTGGTRTSDVQKLAASLGAEISTDNITSTSGAEARIVLGTDANK